MLTLSRMERHSTDIAGLQGARIVTAPETHRGRAWDEAKLKQITGGDAIAARLMKRDNVVFSPTFKLLITGNHKPSLSSPDEAMRRRFHLIPFRVTIPHHLRDDKLGLRLRAEWPGILLWAIQGCANWQRVGLAPPAAVRDATAQYFAEEDVTARWLHSHAEPDADARAKLSDLYSSFKIWACAASLPIGSQKDFAEHLERLGLGRTRDKTGNFWTGYRLSEKSQ
jgi:putative DNA primase/helicase